VYINAVIVLHTASQIAEAQAASKRELNKLRSEVRARHTRQKALEQEVAGFSIIEKERSTLAARLAALQSGGQQQALQNATELDSLRADLFSMRIKLETVFRKTLQGLNSACQEQALDTMLTDAQRARDEILSLSRRLCKQTGSVGGRMAAQQRTSRAVAQLKIDEDLLGASNALLQQRVLTVQRAVKAQEAKVLRQQQACTAAESALAHLQGTATSGSAEGRTTEELVRELLQVRAVRDSLKAKVRTQHQEANLLLHRSSAQSVKERGSSARSKMMHSKSLPVLRRLSTASALQSTIASSGSVSEAAVDVTQIWRASSCGVTALHGVTSYDYAVD
jgi:cell division protein FtsL